ncbi:hypothetical protein OAX78_03655 [Planctomycetota bacterium]|nr:hypothetical protein [Planctomycetota bacterium]
MTFMRTGVRRMLLTAVLLTGLLLLPSEAQALYLFYMRRDLAHELAQNPDDLVGKKVVFTDELVILWERDSARPETINGRRYILFDTEYFHCALPADRLETHLTSISDDSKAGYQEILNRLEAVNASESSREISASEAVERRANLWWELYRVWSNQPIVTCFGTVERANFWGDVRGGRNGVATERVTIVLDRVEKPRDRWYRSLDEF